MIAAELTERVWAWGDCCARCDDHLEPGDLAVWTDPGERIHASCAELENVLWEPFSAE